jgi:ABC-type branched-subunit amino acid transport system substrate-binding protein
MDDRHLIILVEESDSTVGFYDSQEGTEVARVLVGHWPHEIALDPEQRYAYVTNFGVKDYDENIGRPGASISQIDIQNKCETSRLYTFRDRAEYQKFRGPHGVKVTPNGRRLYVNVETTDAILIYDLVGGGPCPEQEIRTGSLHPSGLPADQTDAVPDAQFGIQHDAHNFIFSSGGEHLWVFPSGNGVRRLDPHTGRLTGEFECGGPVRGLTYTADQSYLIASCRGEVSLVDPETLFVVRRTTGLDARQILYSAPTPDGRYILSPAVWESQLLVIDTADMTVRHRIMVGVDPISVLVAPHGRSAYVTHGRSRFLSEIDLENFQEVRRIPTRGGPNGIATAPYSPRPSREKLRFGACLPLSNLPGQPRESSAIEGRDLRLGYQFWQELVNEAGGLVINGKPYEIELHFRDTRSSVEAAVIAGLTRELLAEGVQYMLGTYPSPPNEHSGRVCDAQKVPFVTASGAAGRIYNQGFRYVFGAMTSAASFLVPTVEMLFARLAEEDRPRSALFISCEDPAAFQDARTTAQDLASRGVEVLVPSEGEFDVVDRVVRYRHLTADAAAFARYIDLAAGLAPDLLINTGHLPEAVAITQAARNGSITPKALIFSVGPALPDFVAQLAGAAEHMLAAAMWTPTQIERGHDRFIEPGEFQRRFFERFSAQPSYLAAGAMACGLVYEAALRAAQSAASEPVRDAIARVNLETFYSHIEFDEKGLNAGRRLVTIQLRRKDGEIVHVPLWPLDVGASHELAWPFPGWP